MTVQLDCRFLALWRSGSEAAFFSPVIAAPERPEARSCSSSVGLPRLLLLLPPPELLFIAPFSFRPDQRRSGRFRPHLRRRTRAVRRPRGRFAEATAAAVERRAHRTGP